MIKYIELFILIFIIVFIIYKLILRKFIKTKNKYPMEIVLLMNIYKLDIKKVNYKKLLNTVAIVSSIDIALIVSVAGIFREGYLQLILSLCLIIPILLFSYYLISIYYKKGK